MSADPNPVFILLAIFCPFGVVVTILGALAILAYHRQAMRTRELATELVLQMLNRKQSVEEIERVLLAWSQDPELARSMGRARKQLSGIKPATSA